MPAHPNVNSAPRAGRLGPRLTERMAGGRTGAHVSTAARADEARTAGRGLVSITGAKLWFIAVGYLVQFLLPRLLGSAAAYGLYATAINLASMVNNVLIAATVQSVSKLVSENEEQAPATLRRALGVQLVLGLTIAGAAYAVAPWLAHDVLHDAALEPLLRVCCAIVVAYALYAALIGSANGRRLFQKQAALDMTFSTMRTAALLGAAATGLGVLGAVSGFAAAAVAILGIALVVVGTGKSGKTADWSRWLVILGPLWLYQIFLNGTMQIDLPILKALVAGNAAEAGATSEAAAELASQYAGYYRTAQTFAFVPYQLIISVTFVVFPLVSRATSGGDLEATRAYVRNAMRFSLLVLLAFAAPIAGASNGVLRIVYPAEYAAADGALSVLAFAMVAFALFVIAATVLGGAGRPGTAATIAAIALALVVGANLVLVGRAGANESALVAAATGTAVGTAFALVAVGVVVHRQFGAFLPPVSVLRGLVAAAAATAVAHYVPHASRVMALVALTAGGLTYLALLVATREVGRTELDLVRKIARRGK